MKQPLPHAQGFQRVHNGTEMMGLFQSGLNSVAGVAAMIPLQPPAASSIAGGVDKLYYFLSGITAFFSVLIFSIIFYFMLKITAAGQTHRSCPRNSLIAGA